MSLLHAQAQPRPFFFGELPVMVGNVASGTLISMGHGLKTYRAKKRSECPARNQVTAATIVYGKMAIKRHGRPEEIAGMVVWLAEPEASFVTGSMPTVNGGFGA
jgi:NAD(P)-dependent dehydrogenase (short-subunit alcohol dehydrogenase family)